MRTVITIVRYWSIFGATSAVWYVSALAILSTTISCSLNPSYETYTPKYLVAPLSSVVFPSSL